VVARFGAFLAVLGIVLGTLVTAGFANISANPADLLSVFTSLGHKGSRQLANLRALAIQTNTLGHHFHIIFLQASRRARITINGTDITRFNTRLIFFKFHLSTLLVIKRRRGLYLTIDDKPHIETQLETSLSASFKRVEQTTSNTSAASGLAAI
jgi:hypothetical protein